MKPASLLLSMTLTLVGCASAVQERNAIRYANAAYVAQQRGDWDTARRAYARAVMNAEQAGLREDQQAIFHYEYGRALGVTCFFQLSEKELRTALELDKRAEQPVYLALVELARLHLDQRKFAQASEYFERAKQALDDAGAEDAAPRAYADIIDEYGQALAASGRPAAARQLVEQASAIRQGSPNRLSSADRTPYGTECAKR